MHACLPALCVDAAIARAASVVVVVDDDTAANVHANADVDDACSNVDGSARCFYDVAYVVADDAVAETKMPNATRHLASANDVLMLLLLLVMMLVMLVMLAMI